MKEKGVTKTALILLVLVCVFAIVACSDNVCNHVYTEKADAKYLKSAATCTEKAVYYKSCSLCGEKDTATFEYGEALGHSYSAEWSYNSKYHWKVVTCGCDVEQDYIEHTLNNGGECTICKQQIVGTAGVVYELYDSYAVVTGYTGTESKVKIAAFYNDLPVTRIDDKAFFFCTSLTSVTISNNITSIGEDAFSGCTSLTRVYITDIAAWCNISFEGSGEYLLYVANPLYYAKNLYLNNNLVTALTIPDSVTSIGNRAFFGCMSLTSVTIGSGVTSIGEDAFYCCMSLTSVTISSGVTSIGNGAFYYCTSLTNVTIGNNVTSIGNYAFYCCTSLTSVTIPDSVTSIGSSAFYYCTSLTSITIPDSVTSIGYDAFENCTSLTSVYITDMAAWCKISFNGSDSNPLYYTKNLYLNNNLVTALAIPDGVTSIGDYAFSGCRSLTSVTIPDNVTSIDEGAFYHCTSLTSVTIGNNVTNIGDYAFRGCTSLTNITIPDNVTSIGGGAFRDCTSLTSVTIGNGVTSIGDWLFTGCKSLTSVTISNSVTSIGDYTFYNCASLTSVTIGNNVTSIGNYAFSGCSSLEKVYYKGTAADWGRISISTKNNSYLTNATRYYYSESEPTESGNYWHYVDGKVTVWVTDEEN